MLKTLFISHSSYWGGAEKCLYLLLKGLSRDRFEPIVLLPGDNALKAAIEELGIETREGPFLPWVRPWMDFTPNLDFEQGVAQIVELIRNEQVDLVCSNTSVVAGGALAAMECGIPHVWHVLEMLSQDPAANPPMGFRQFYMLLDMLTDRVIAASESVKADIEQYLSSTKIDVIHTGIEVTSERQPVRSKNAVFGIPEETFVVSFVGDLSERKGADDLVRCAPKVLAHDPDAHFMVVGRDAEKATAIRKRIAQSDLGESVKLLGFRNDVENVMAASDVFVLPTLADPLPLVVQEAMSVGTPVIATRSGGCSDMIVDGETGFLVPVKDPDALARSIISLMDSPDLRTTMGQKGYQRLVNHFSHENYVQKMSDVFTELAGQKTDSTVRMTTDDLARLLVPCLDALGARYHLEFKNRQLTESLDAIESAFTTRLGRSLTWPWRVLRSLVSK